MVWVDAEILAAGAETTPRETREILDLAARGAKARFYTDENFPDSAVSLLREMGARVRTAREAGLIHHDDSDHAAYALRNGLILLTCDRDFLDENRFPLIHCPTIFVFNFASGSVREVRQAFRCLALVLLVPQFFDKWLKVDAKRESWTEYERFLDGSTSRSRHRLWRGRLQEWVDDEG